MSAMSDLGARQRGMGFLGLILVIGLAAFFGTILFKLGPLYLNFWTVRTVMEETAQQAASIEGGARGIQSSIDKRLYINAVEEVAAKDFQVKKIDTGRYQVNLDYEARVHLFFNVDAVASFSHQVEVETE
jgi:hypothetical protein